MSTPMSRRRRAWSATFSIPAISGLTISATSEAWGLDQAKAGLVGVDQIENYQTSPAATAIGFVNSGHGRVEWRTGRGVLKRASGPGAVTIVPHDEPFVYSCRGHREVLGWFLDPAMLRSIAERDLNLGDRPPKILPSHSIQDERLWELGRRLTEELKWPRYGSRLYFESMCVQIVIHLLRYHSSIHAPSEPEYAGIADERIVRAVELIHDSLGFDLSLETLADEAGLSVGHFISAFREAMGRPPYQYVLEQRVEKAKELLANPTRSIASISFDVGFSSQSHLTSVFRRVTGMTPKRYRDELARGSRRMVAPSEPLSSHS